MKQIYYHFYVSPPDNIDWKVESEYRCQEEKHKSDNIFVSFLPFYNMYGSMFKYYYFQFIN